jgi:hypothetical protein
MWRRKKEEGGRGVLTEAVNTRDEEEETEPSR